MINNNNNDDLNLKSINNDFTQSTSSFNTLDIDLSYLEAKTDQQNTKKQQSTNPQFQMFKTLLGLCGISQKSLKNLMIVFNFLFILIDHFVIYIFCLVLVNVSLKFLL